MTSRAMLWPRWSTSTLADMGDTRPAEAEALGAHMTRCNGARGAWFALACAADAAHGFLAGRLVTTLLIAALMIGAASVWL